MEVIIRKKDLDIVTDMFKKVCDREEEKPNVRITLEHKCCLAYVADCPGNRTKFIGYTNPKPQVPVNMRDDQETLMKLKREVTRLRLMKEGLSEETKEALAKAAAANNKKAEAEKEEEAESKKLQLEKQQEIVNENKEKKEEKFNALMNPNSASGATGAASGAASGAATGSDEKEKDNKDSKTTLLQVSSSKLRGNSKNIKNRKK